MKPWNKIRWNCHNDFSSPNIIEDGGQEAGNITELVEQNQHNNKRRATATTEPIDAEEWGQPGPYFSSDNVNEWDRRKRWKSDTV